MTQSSWMSLWRCQMTWYYVGSARSTRPLQAKLRGKGVFSKGIYTTSASDISTDNFADWSRLHTCQRRSPMRYSSHWETMLWYVTSIISDCIAYIIQVDIYLQWAHSFYSIDDGSRYKDIIRCNPKVYGRTRFDTVLVQTDTGPRPARLHLLFSVTAYQQPWDLAFITYFTSMPAVAQDKRIGMTRYQEEIHGEVVPLASILHSCYLTPLPNSETTRQFYLNHLIRGDTDLFLRIQDMNTWIGCNTINDTLFYRIYLVFIMATYHMSLINAPSDAIKLS